MADPKSRFEIYPDSGGKWRWRLIASNGTQVASSGESFDSKSNAERAAEATRRAAMEADAEVAEAPAG